MNDLYDFGFRHGLLAHSQEKREFGLNTNLLHQRHLIALRQQHTRNSKILLGQRTQPLHGHIHLPLNAQHIHIERLQERILLPRQQIQILHEHLRNTRLRARIIQHDILNNLDQTVQDVAVGEGDGLELVVELDVALEAEQVGVEVLGDLGYEADLGADQFEFELADGFVGGLD